MTRPGENRYGCLAQDSNLQVKLPPSSSSFGGASGGGGASAVAHVKPFISPNSKQQQRDTQGVPSQGGSGIGDVASRKNWKPLSFGASSASNSSNSAGKTSRVK